MFCSMTCELSYHLSVCLAKASLNTQGLFSNQVDKRLKALSLPLVELSFSPQSAYHIVNVKQVDKHQINTVQINMLSFNTIFV